MTSFLMESRKKGKTSSPTALHYVCFLVISPIRRVVEVQMCVGFRRLYNKFLLDDDGVRECCLCWLATDRTR